VYGSEVTAASPADQVDAEIRRLRAACYSVVRDLAAAGPDLIVVVGGGEVTRAHPGSAAGSLTGLGIPFSTGTGDPVLPLSLTIGSWLLRHCLGSADAPVCIPADVQAGMLADEPADVPLAGPAGRPESGSVAGSRHVRPDPAGEGSRGPALTAGGDPAGGGSRGSARTGAWRAVLQEVTQSWSASECTGLGRRLASAAPRVALLAMGDGPARKVLGVPGSADPATERYDAAVSSALAGCDTSALAALDPQLDEEYLVAGRAAWQVLTGAGTGARLDGQLRYAAAPLDVSYFVAFWQLSSPGRPRKGTDFLAT